MKLLERIGPGRPIARISISKISIQPDLLKQETEKPLQLEILQLKRALIDIRCQASTESELKAILEYKGRTLILSRSKGNCDPKLILDGLAADHYHRYGSDGLAVVVTRDKAGICESTIDDPSEFLEYLHLIHTRGGLTIDKRKLRMRGVMRAFENL